MTIQLNDKFVTVPDSSTLEYLLLNELNITPDKKGMAIAVNENIIPKKEWKNYQLKNNDQILVIIAAQGG